MRTTRAPIVLGVCGWALAPRTAHPRVGSALSSFTWGQCPTVSGRAAHYHTLEQPQSLSTRHTRVSRGRGSTARPITPTHGNTAWRYRVLVCLHYDEQKICSIFLLVQYLGGHRFPHA